VSHPITARDAVAPDGAHLLRDTRRWRWAGLISLVMLWFGLWESSLALALLGNGLMVGSALMLRRLRHQKPIPRPADFATGRLRDLTLSRTGVPLVRGRPDWLRPATLWLASLTLLTVFLAGVALRGFIQGDLLAGLSGGLAALVVGLIAAIPFWMVMGDRAVMPGGHRDGGALREALERAGFSATAADAETWERVGPGGHARVVLPRQACNAVRLVLTSPIDSLQLRPRISRRHVQWRTVTFQPAFDRIIAIRGSAALALRLVPAALAAIREAMVHSALATADGHKLEWVFDREPDDQVGFVVGRVARWLEGLETAMEAVEPAIELPTEGQEAARHIETLTKQAVGPMRGVYAARDAFGHQRHVVRLWIEATLKRMETCSEEVEAFLQRIIATPSDVIAPVAAQVALARSEAWGAVVATAQTTNPMETRMAVLNALRFKWPLSTLPGLRTTRRAARFYTEKQLLDEAIAQLSQSPEARQLRGAVSCADVVEAGGELSAVGRTDGGRLSKV